MSAETRPGVRPDRPTVDRPDNWVEVSDDNCVVVKAPAPVVDRPNSWVEVRLVICGTVKAETSVAAREKICDEPSPINCVVVRAAIWVGVKPAMAVVGNWPIWVEVRAGNCCDGSSAPSAELGAQLAELNQRLEGFERVRRVACFAQAFPVEVYRAVGQG